MPRGGGNKTRTRKRNKNNNTKKYKCLECLDTGIIVKDVKMLCPYCDLGE